MVSRVYYFLILSMLFSNCKRPIGTYNKYYYQGQLSLKFKKNNQFKVHIVGHQLNYYETGTYYGIDSLFIFSSDTWKIDNQDTTYLFFKDSVIKMENKFFAFKNGDTLFQKKYYKKLRRPPPRRSKW